MTQIYFWKEGFFAAVLSALPFEAAGVVGRRVARVEGNVQHACVKTVEKRLERWDTRAYDT